MEEPCCFVFGKRGKNILQDGDFFQYSKNYTKKEKSYWKCVISSCKGRAITSGDFIVEKIHHDHTADISLVRARNIETNLIKNSQNLSPRKIIAEIAQKLQVTIKTNINLYINIFFNYGSQNKLEYKDDIKSKIHHNLLEPHNHALTRTTYSQKVVFEFDILWELLNH